ncbi:MAG: hypothetical protein E3J21_00990 [Anaerolineales bacterium]|nr:MAG: hypothetical protein E3J21_00990 [Anaerolineales bacterium]
MANREWIEILAAHADKLNAGTNEETEYLATLPEHRDTLQPLLTVAQKVKDALAPVEPDSAFCENLRLSLLAAAHQRSTSRLSLWAEGSTKSQRPVRLFRRHRKEILIGAAALGSVVSVAGIVAYWIHIRAAKAQRALPS